MFRQQKKVKEVLHSFSPSDSGLILVRGEKMGNIEILSNSLDTIQRLDSVTAYDFELFFGRIIFTNFKATKTFVFDLADDSLKELPFILHLPGSRFKDLLLCPISSTTETLALISLEGDRIISQYDDLMGWGVQSLTEDYFILSKKRKGLIGFYNLKKGKDNFRTIEISSLASFTDHDGDHSGRIDDVQVVGDKVIVMANYHVLAYDLDTGKLLWQTKLDFRFIQMTTRGDEGYIVTNHHYVVMDLNTGQITHRKDMGWFDFHGNKLQFDGYRPLYHEGLVWCCQLTNGYTFISAIYPETGEVVWQEHVNTGHSLKPPKFHDNKMYILDSGGTLHIYEKT